MVRLALVGNVPPQTPAIAAELTGYPLLTITDPEHLPYLHTWKPSLIIVAGWRRLIPAEYLALAPTVGFHSAKLPEYPGRAPVPWTLVRGDPYAWNTLLYLDEGVDSGDVIDQRAIKVYPSDTPEVLYTFMARSGADMLRRHLPSLLDGTAPRTPQDPGKRGPLTTPDGWRIWEARQHGLVLDSIG
jgi:methionyl-tRNA formyltransferase